MDQAVFGLIGAGGIAQSQHLPNLTRAPHVRLKTLCDLDEDRLTRMQAKYRVPEATRERNLAEFELYARDIVTHLHERARAEESAQAAEQLAKLAEDLQDLVSKFKLAA